MCLFLIKLSDLCIISYLSTCICVTYTGVKYIRMERRHGKFLKKFQLPENANSENICACYQDGVLTVTVQKKPPPEPRKPKTIQVQIGSPENHSPAAPSQDLEDQENRG